MDAVTDTGAGNLQPEAAQQDREVVALNLSPAWQAAVERRLAKIEAGGAAYIGGGERFAQSDATIQAERAGR